MVMRVSCRSATRWRTTSTWWRCRAAVRRCSRCSASRARSCCSTSSRDSLTTCTSRCTGSRMPPCTLKCRSNARSRTNARTRSRQRFRANAFAPMHSRLRVSAIASALTRSGSRVVLTRLCSRVSLHAFENACAPSCLRQRACASGLVRPDAPAHPDAPAPWRSYQVFAPSL
eukprot:6199686-Pleurochrysis_carterae.AAC.5